MIYDPYKYKQVFIKEITNEGLLTSEGFLPTQFISPADLEILSMWEVNDIAHLLINMKGWKEYLQKVDKQTTQ